MPAENKQTGGVQLTELRDTYNRRLSALRQQQERVAKVEQRREDPRANVGMRAQLRAVGAAGGRGQSQGEGDDDNVSLEFDVVSDGDFDDECPEDEPDDNGSRAEPSPASVHANRSAFFLIGFFASGFPACTTRSIGGDDGLFAGVGSDEDSARFDDDDDGDDHSRDESVESRRRRNGNQKTAVDAEPRGAGREDRLPPEQVRTCITARACVAVL